VATLPPPTSFHGNMKWFTNNKKRLEMISAIRPTSKATLKMQCLMVCKGNIDEALKLYDFFAKDMPDLPDFDPVPPTWQQNTAQTVNGIMSWLKENSGTIQQAYSMVQQIIANKGVLPIAPEAPAAEPLPPIN
jgi:hypothetical protein